MNIDKYLPIGTVCTIKNHQKKVMIVGVFSIEYNGTVKMYDYKGCDYPEGLLLSNKIQSFNHSDIENIVYMGYKDEFYETFNHNITKQNQPVDSSSLEKKPFAANIQFDENGVVVYDPIETTNYKSTVGNAIQAPVQMEKANNVSNPFVPVQNVQSTQPNEDSKNWSIFKNIQFDENGVVISAEEYTKEELNNKE